LQKWEQYVQVDWVDFLKKQKRQDSKTHWLNKQPDFLCQFLNFNWPNTQKIYSLIYFNRFP
jgi:hypothetical protein